ncbi:MAG: holo-ACP synthase [Spirochaetes bacterium]|nr:holo-ACP synthase [Spirochaetota bacterium]
MDQGFIVGIGTDIVDVRRLRRMNVEHRDRFTQKNLSREEISLLPDTNPETFIAGRYASKEALAKALGFRDFSNAAITVLNDGTGRPYFENADTLVRNREPREFYTFHLSISHDFDFAVAFVVIERTVEKIRSSWI